MSDPSDVRSIKSYRTSPLTLYAPLKFIIRRKPLTKLKSCIGLKKRVTQSRNLVVKRFRTPLHRKFLSR